MAGTAPQERGLPHTTVGARYHWPNGRVKRDLSVPERGRCRAEHTGPPARSRAGVDREGEGRQRAGRRTTRAVAELPRHQANQVAREDWALRWESLGDRGFVASLRRELSRTLSRADLADDRRPFDRSDDLHAWSSHGRPGCGRTFRPRGPRDRTPGNSPDGVGARCHDLFPITIGKLF